MISRPMLVTQSVPRGSGSLPDRVGARMAAAVRLWDRLPEPKPPLRAIREALERQDELLFKWERC
jgi:hypothetical protein